MNTLNIEIEAISNLALQVMQAVLDENDKVKRFEEDDSGPLALASALSDFFQIASALQTSDQEFDPGQVSELADYGLDLLDRLSFQSQSLELMKHRELVSRMFASIAVWFARSGAELNNLTGAADGFGRLVNGLNDTAELAAMCDLMEEVIEAASAELARDEDRSEHWRPWRVLNLNQGIVATRSLDPQLIEQTYEQLTRRLPHDMPGFLADGKRNMIGQNVPDEVQEVVKRYADKWPAPLAH